MYSIPICKQITADQEHSINVHVLVSQNMTLFRNGLNPPIDQIWKMTSNVMVINQGTEKGHAKSSRKEPARWLSCLGTAELKKTAEDFYVICEMK